MPLVVAMAAGAGTVWLAPSAVDRDTLAWTAAAAAGIAAAGFLAAAMAWSELGRRDRAHRRERALAAWREDAFRDDGLDEDDRDDGAEAPTETGPGAADLRALLDAVEDAAVLLDRDGWVMAANMAATAALGAAAVPESRWDERTAWPAPLVPVRRVLPGGGAVIVGRDPVLDRLRAAQIEGMDAMATLAGAIVHDVNNALGAVAGYADFLVADLPADSPQADYAVRILRAVDHSKAVLRRILAACRNAPPEFRAVAPGRVLNDTASLLRVSLAPGVGLSVREEPELPDFPGNAALLARTLAAIGADIRGAADARLGLRAVLWTGTVDAATAPPGWSVQVPLSPRRRPHAMFELRSSGAPRPMAELRAALDPLLAARARARQPAAEADAPPAALTVARWHDGGLVVWTHPVEGTVARLFIPLTVPPGVPAESESTAAPRCPIPRYPIPRCHVLVVDDEPAMGDWLSVNLERMGCEVAVCESAGEALEIVMDEPACFDVVIAGPSAGGMTGPALIVRLKALRPGLSCVLCGEPGGEPGAEPIPADLFLPRPVDAAALARAVATFTPAPGRPQ